MTNLRIIMFQLSTDDNISSKISRSILVVGGKCGKLAGREIISRESCGNRL